MLLKLTPLQIAKRTWSEPSDLEYAIETDNEAALHKAVRDKVSHQLRFCHAALREHAISHCFDSVMAEIEKVRGTDKHNVRWLAKHISNQASWFAADHRYDSLPGQSNVRAHGDRSFEEHQHYLANWQELAESDKENTALKILHTMMVDGSRGKNRYAERMQRSRETLQLVANESGLTVDQCKALFVRVASTLVDEETLKYTEEKMAQLRDGKREPVRQRCKNPALSRMPAESAQTEMKHDGRRKMHRSQFNGDLPDQRQD